VKFIQKDIDRRLLFLIIIIIILFAGVTIYYEVTLNDAVSKYKKSQQAFGGLTADAVLEQLNATSQVKEGIRKYKGFLEKKYDDLDTINKNFQNQIENLKAELAIVKSQVEYQKARDMGPTEQFRLFQRKNEEIDKLKKKISELCSEFESNHISDAYCSKVSWNQEFIG